MNKVEVDSFNIILKDSTAQYIASVYYDLNIPSGQVETNFPQEWNNNSIIKE